MKIHLFPKLVVATAVLFFVSLDRSSVHGAGDRSDLSGWGEPVDPDADCKFFIADGDLLISIPGSARPHDLAADVNCTNAPRIVRSTAGEFTIQVKVDGRFAPGTESTLPNRVGYNGAGIVAIVDVKNVVTLARAVIHRSGEEPHSYINFEIRCDGNLQRIGFTGDCPIPNSGPVFLRLERRGQKFLGAVSNNGNDWTTLDAKEIPANWPKELQAGIVAISSSTQEFNPRFSKLQVLK